MPEISLTDFVDFVSISGSARLTRVRDILDRGEYDPIRDFWRELRNGLVAWHASGVADRRNIEELLNGVPELKLEHYRSAIEGYRKFLGRKSVTWFEPPRVVWTHGAMNIRINPEIGLEINGEKHIIKLHFKSRPISKRKVECILLLMEDAMRSKVAPDVHFSVLDVWKGRLLTSNQPRWNLRPYLIGEAQAFTTMWTELQDMRAVAARTLWGPQAGALRMSEPPAQMLG